MAVNARINGHGHNYQYVDVTVMGEIHPMQWNGGLSSIWSRCKYN
jgi:6-pyruvoyl-tetrahydropterin synthase